MATRSPKDPAIEHFLGALTRSGCPWELADHWESDLAAVGVSRPGSPQQLAYLSAGGDPATYFVELEVAPAAESEAVYDVVGRAASLTLEEAVGFVRDHLGPPEGNMLSHSAFPHPNP